MSPRTRNTLPTPFEQQLIAAAMELVEGEVVSYGDLASRAGRPRASRAAGRLMANLDRFPQRQLIPWWRVVYSDGRLPVCDPTQQTDLLENEGVVVEGSRVVCSPAGRFAARR